MGRMRGGGAQGKGAGDTPNPARSALERPLDPPLDPPLDRPFNEFVGFFPFLASPGTPPICSDFASDFNSDLPTKLAPSAAAPDPNATHMMRQERH